MLCQHMQPEEQIVSKGNLLGLVLNRQEVEVANHYLIKKVMEEAVITTEIILLVVDTILCI